jgi:hypothetical protein
MISGGGGESMKSMSLVNQSTEIFGSCQTIPMQILIHLQYVYFIALQTLYNNYKYGENESK